MDEHERRRSRSFGEDAAAYDRTRPSYPPALIDALAAGAPRVLDVGCGTGKVGRLFLERGCEVLGVEPDERMAEVARSHGLEVEVAPFETWDGHGRTFDLVVSGQAWHWVDPVEGARAAARVLRPGGRLAVFWNMLDHAPDTKAALSAVYEGYPEISRPVALGIRSGHEPLAGIDEATGFGPQTVTVHEWTEVHTKAEWLDQLPTHSDHRLMPPARLASLLAEVGDVIDAHGGSLTLLYETLCWTATRLDG